MDSASAPIPTRSDAWEDRCWHACGVAPTTASMRRTRNFTTLHFFLRLVFLGDSSGLLRLLGLSRSIFLFFFNEKLRCCCCSMCSEVVFVLFVLIFLVAHRVWVDIFSMVEEISSRPMPFAELEKQILRIWFGVTGWKSKMWGTVGDAMRVEISAVVRDRV